MQHPILQLLHSDTLLCRDTKTEYLISSGRSHPHFRYPTTLTKFISSVIDVTSKNGAAIKQVRLADELDHDKYKSILLIHKHNTCFMLDIVIQTHECTFLRKLYNQMYPQDHFFVSSSASACH